MDIATTIATDHETRLDRLAEVAVRVGLGGFHPGQELLLTAPLEALPLARRITAQAYRAGAALVTTLLTDDQSTLLRYRLAGDSSFDTAAGWLYEGMAAAFRGGAARLAIAGEDPSLLSAEDPAKVARANHARSLAYRPALELITDTAINWSICASATPAWAQAVFPDLPPERRARPAVGRDLRHFARRYRRPGRRMGGAQRHPDGAPPHAEREALRRAAFPRARHRSARRPGGRA